MPVAYYRLSAAFAASLSLIVAACGTSTPNPPVASTSAGQPAAGSASASGQQIAAKNSGEMDTEATIWTVLGLAKRPSYREPGPQTGSTVSPILWQAALDTLGFVKFASEDPLGGSLVSDWYTPSSRPDERFRITVFILSRHLSSSALTVTVDRQERSATGEWVDSTVASKVVDQLETKILYRARQLKQEWVAAAKAS
jgi:Domain of unknown function (DUF3576)